MLGNRNIAQMKGRYKQLNESAGKWIGIYREAYRKRRSGLSMKDVENKAHKLYETSGSKFNDAIVFNEVMFKHQKWDIQLDQDATRSRLEYEVGDEESGVAHKDQGRDAAKRKEKGKFSNEVVAELRALRLSRDSEVEVMKKRLDLDQQRDQKTDERELVKMQSLHMNTLLQNEHLSSEEENKKRFLISMFYGN
ncbi:unnamed protein product [Lactuca virosa]|uniref:No apical meristem-associated C-terminal domain-containing protein n=1 Tax=Lactuca virosa TaxID=75947 RepID=A0AAU9N5I2_9ASTR|nr:unnamed protein product [Lactuca virosa]